MDAGQMIVTIDGPAGAGKTTLARTLAGRLGWTYLDTGAMYRAVGLAAFEAGADVSREETLARVLDGLDLKVAPGREATRVFLNGRDVTERIREPDVSGLASEVSAHGVVRRAMVEIQRELGENGRVVAEGRDMGTVVFPGAGIKFFLTASLEERARRRYDELKSLGAKSILSEVTAQMASRDQADSSRDLSPLRPAPEATRIDTTPLSIEDVLALMLTKIREKWGDESF